jgi:hypothetical protein
MGGRDKRFFRFAGGGGARGREILIWINELFAPPQYTGFGI